MLTSFWQTAWHMVAIPADTNGRLHAQGLRLRAASGRQPSVGDAAPDTGSARASAAAASSVERSARQAACASQDESASANLTAANMLPAGAPDSSPVSFDAMWSPNGAGAPATALLRKLRWLTVGPRYDWTDRCMDCASLNPQHDLHRCVTQEACSSTSTDIRWASREPYLPGATALQGV